MTTKYSSGTSTSKLSGGARGVTYSSGKSTSKTAMPSLNVKYSAGQKYHETNRKGDPNGAPVNKK